ncbi:MULTISPECIES: substrate-binding domain-containing protein [unclassified Arthrobacter]|uniref:sugar ABC transporter substrate-binding protein n=1 Tax=unclassified Arthrobacter TaxID=235627 RepID=UPI00288331EE|nr:MULTISPECIES: substrate-binding domain-containing protein [unclassified Arthrobacter]
MARSYSRGITALIVGVTLSSMVLTGCDSGSPGASTAGGTQAASSPELEAVFKGNEGTPPVTSPPPAKGKSVWWISCGQQTQSCASYAAAGEAAAKALGWDFHLADGNLNQANGYATAMRTALAARPDAIIQDAFSCTTVQPELQQAKELGVPVLGLETLDCSDAGTGPSLFTIPMIYSETYPDNKAWWTGWGAWSAKFLAADSGGTAKVITSMGQGDPQFDLLNGGFKSELAKCSGCSIATDVSWTVTDLAPNGPWVTALRNALIKYPDANYVWWPFDTNGVDAGGAKAVLQGGSKPKVVSGIGTAPALDLVRSGQMHAEGVARSSEWLSWAAMDQVNRYFNKQPSVPQGVGFISIDKNHNMPEQSGDGYKTAVPFEQLYKKAWGVG